MPSSHCSVSGFRNPSPHVPRTHVDRHASPLEALPSSFFSGLGESVLVALVPLVVQVSVSNSFASSFLHTDPQDSVPAFGDFARGQAGIVVTRIPVVATLHPVLKESVSATGIHTVRGIHRYWRCCRHRIAPHPPGQSRLRRARACIGATVPIHFIAIIAGFNPRLDEPISTTGDFAGAQAGIVIGGVPIITGFLAFLDESIPADGVLAVLRHASG